MEAFDRDIFAPSGRAAKDDLWATWVCAAELWNLPPVPLTPELVRKVLATFKASRYRSVGKCVSRARIEHEAVMQVPVPPNVERLLKQGVRSVTRGLGGPRPKAGFDFALLANEGVLEACAAPI